MYVFLIVMVKIKIPVPRTHPKAGSCCGTVYKIYYLILFFEQIILQTKGQSKSVVLRLLRAFAHALEKAQGLVGDVVQIGIDPEFIVDGKTGIEIQKELLIIIPVFKGVSTTFIHVGV